jgi:hypothetical protein
LATVTNGHITPKMYTLVSAIIGINLRINKVTSVYRHCLGISNTASDSRNHVEKKNKSISVI